MEWLSQCCGLGLWSAGPVLPLRSHTCGGGAYNAAIVNEHVFSNLPVSALPRAALEGRLLNTLSSTMAAL